VRKYLRVWSAYSTGLRGVVRRPAKCPDSRCIAFSRSAFSYKGVDGVLETVGGILLLLVSPKALNSLVIFLLRMNCPKILTIGLPPRCAMAFSSLVGHQTFRERLPVAHGLIKFFLVAGLLARETVGVPTALWFLGIFLRYQLYRFSHTHSLGLFALSAFDIFMVALVWLEYRIAKTNVLWRR